MLEIIFERTFRTPTSGREIEALEGITDECSIQCSIEGKKVVIEKNKISDKEVLSLFLYSHR